MVAVNQAFKEVSSLVSEQGVMVDKIEENTSKAADNTEEGIKDLRVYNIYYRKHIIYKRKLIVLFVNIIFIFI